MRTRTPRPAAVVFLLAASLAARPVTAATLPAGFVETVVSGLTPPTAMALAPDGCVFIAQQGGAVRIVKAGVLLPAPFLALTVDSTGERGLIGIALDPAFDTSGVVYVHYTVPAGGGVAVHNRVSRYTASGDTVVPGSAVTLVDLDPLTSATNHNGGAIHFGPDGKLYVAVGENATAANAQTLANRLGKILRYNADGSIPTDNPGGPSIPAQRQAPASTRSTPGRTRTQAPARRRSSWASRPTVSPARTSRAASERASRRAAPRSCCAGSRQVLPARRVRPEHRDGRVHARHAHAAGARLARDGHRRPRRERDAAAAVRGRGLGD